MWFDLERSSDGAVIAAGRWMWVETEVHVGMALRPTVFLISTVQWDWGAIGSNDVCQIRWAALRCFREGWWRVDLYLLGMNLELLIWQNGCELYESLCFAHLYPAATDCCFCLGFFVKRFQAFVMEGNSRMVVRIKVVLDFHGNESECVSFNLIEGNSKITIREGFTFVKESKACWKTPQNQFFSPKEFSKKEGN